MTQIKREHAAIAVCVVAGAFVAGGAFSPIKPSKATDCDSGWMSTVINDAQKALGQDDHGISEGERNQIAEIYRSRGVKVNPDDIRVSEQTKAVQPVAPTTQSFNPSTPMPPQQTPAASPELARIAVPSAAIPRSTAPRTVYQGVSAAPPPIASSAPLSDDAKVDAGIFEVNRREDCVGLPANMRCVVVGQPPIVTPPARSRGGENVEL